MNIDHYTYRVTWSGEDNEHVGRYAFRPGTTVFLVGSRVDDSKRGSDAYVG